jgi:iron(III) transport system permease protein
MNARGMAGEVNAATVPPGSGWRATFARWFLRALIWLPALVVLAPVLVVIVRAVLSPDTEAWDAMVENRLAGHVRQTLVLALSVTGLAVIMGVPAAWLVSAYRFAGRGLLEWLLVLPLAMPGFVAALAYVDLLQGLTPFYIQVRKSYGIDAFLKVQELAPWLFAVLVLATTLFPYVFLSCRAVFARQASSVIESARSLGAGGARTFFRVALPMARPAVVAGAALVAMEAVNDYGVVASFGLTPLTPGIFRAWSEGHPVVAMRLAVLLLAFIVLARWLEKSQRGRRAYTTESGEAPPARKRLGWRGTVVAWLVCTWPVLLGFGIPVARLTRWAWQSWTTADWNGHWEAAGHSFGMAAGTTLIIAIAAFLLAAGGRAFPGTGMDWARRCGSLGYALPGALVAVGVGAVVSYLARTVPGGASIALSVSVFGLGLAGFARYLAVGLQPIEAGMEKIPRSLHEAARALGRGPVRSLVAVEWPLARPVVVAGAILAFVDLFKELPLALVLRPLDFETLATRVFRLTDEGRIPQAALPGLAMVVMSLLCLLPLTRLLRRSSD